MKLRAKGMLMVIAGILLAFAVFSAQVRADVLYEPMDSFYEEHRDECEYECRTYIANGPDGVLIVYKSPESSDVIERFENGMELFVTYLYTDKDGIVWAQAESVISRFDGWFPLEYAYAKYDNVLFLSDHKSEVRDESGQVPDKYRGEKICVWDYPGGEVTGHLDLSGFEYLPGYHCTFTDEEGRKWGLCGYYYGWRDFWICLDSPTAEESELYPSDKPVRDTREFEEPNVENPENQITPKPSVPVYLIAFVLITVALVVGFSIVMLRMMRK